MSEHWIRLRGGWIAERGDRVEEAGWWTLPLIRAPWPDAPRAVRRSFQTPPIDREREGLWLVIAAMPGIRSIRLNGDSILRDASGRPSHEIRLPNHPPRRCLLELELEEMVSGLEAGEWGQVALVIRGIGPPGEDRV